MYTQKITLLLFLLLFNYTLFSQFVTNDEQIILSPETSPDKGFVSKIGDVDGDDVPDLIVTDHSKDLILWYKRSSDNQILFPNIVATNAIDIRELELGDIDMDGDLDIICGGGSGSISLYWYENLDSKGSFGPRTSIRNYPGFVWELFLTDINKDNFIDIVSSYNGTTNGLYIFYGDGTGLFPSENIVGDFGGVTSLDTGDVDGDSDMDLFAYYIGDSSLVLHTNTDGLGTFNSKRIAPASKAYVYPKSFDYDNDNDLDIAFFNNSDKRVSWMENIDGNGTFGTEQIIESGYSSLYSLVHADLDSNGYEDLLVSTLNNPDYRWLPNSSGGFTVRDTISLTMTPNSSEFYDFDGNGMVDILVSCAISGYPGIIYNYSNADSFSAAVAFPNPSSNPNVSIARNLDSDDGNEIYIAGNGISVLKSNNNGTFSEIRELNNLNFSTIASVDIDNDLDEDLLVASIINDNIAWLKDTSGLGDFDTLKIISEISTNPYNIQAADLFGDGNKEIVACLNNTEIAWIEYFTSSDSFSDKNTFPLGSSFTPKATVLMDVDGDGDKDIVGISQLSDKVSWFENLNGFDSFGTNQLILSIDGPSAIDFGDLNGDGHEDIAFCTISNTVAWIPKTNSTASFESHITLSTSINQGNDIHLADVDGDGDLDILVAEYVGDKISWFENMDGEGTFSSIKTIITGFDGANSVDVADINGDSRPDVLATSINDNKISWFKNCAFDSSFSITKCDEYISPSGKKIQSTQLLLDTTTNIYGCDTVWNIDITILLSSEITDSVEIACDSFLYRGAWRFTSGIYYDTLVNSVGCDSIISFDLTILESNHSIIDTLACDSFESPLGKVTYSSTTLIDSFTNSSGCDSIRYYQVTILEKSFGFIDTSVCNIFITPSGKTVDSSGTVLDTIPNTLGCDSIISISLLVNYRVETDSSITVCDSFVSPNTGKIFYKDTVVSDTVTQINGCDSIITWLVQVIQIDTSIMINGDNSLLANDTLGTYQWLDCGDGFAVINGAIEAYFLPEGSGLFAVEVAYLGCVDTSRCVEVIIGTTNNLESRWSHVYPNPFVDEIRVESNSRIERYQLISLEGTLVQSGPIKNRGINTSPLKNGCYILLLYDDHDNREIHRVIKQ